MRTMCFPDLQAWQVLMNLIWYYLLFACVPAGPGAAAAAAAAICLSFLVGLLNHYVLRFRGRILFPADVARWRTAANVAGAFDFSLDHYIVQAAVLLVAYLFLVWMCPAAEDRMPRLAGALLILFWRGLQLRLLLHRDAARPGHLHPAVGHPGQRLPAELHGGHAVQLGGQAGGLQPGPGAGADGGVPGGRGDGSVTRPVNIIAIMNESFADLTIFEGLEAGGGPHSLPPLHDREHHQGLDVLPGHRRRHGQCGV